MKGLTMEKPSIGGRALKAYCGIGASSLGENEIAAWKQEQYFQYEVRI